MIDCNNVAEGTPTYEYTQLALHLAQGVTDEEVVYTRRVRSVRGRGMK